MSCFCFEDDHKGLASVFATTSNLLLQFGHAHKSLASMWSSTLLPQAARVTLTTTATS
jgi:hypothetical protein